VNQEQIFQYVRYALIFIFTSGVVVEITPMIKCNPISAFLNWMGKKLNAEMKQELDKVNNKVDILQTDLQDHKVESWRRDILDFSSQLMRGEKKTQENFNYIIKIHDKYDKYIEEHSLENGQVDLAYKYISSRYQECLEKNSFL
jgi:hypothetical protein